MISLRHLNRADAPVLREFRYVDMPVEKIQEMIDDWNALVFRGKYFEMFAIINGDKIVGTISLFQLSDSVVSIGPEVFPAFQRRGFGGEAMRLALDMAKDKRYKIVSQQVRSDNHPSIALHKSMGFETDGYRYTNRNGNEVLLFLKAL